MISLKDPTDIASLRFGQLVSVLGTLGQLTEEDEEADDGEARMKAKLQGIYEKSSPQGGEVIFSPLLLSATDLTSPL